MIGLLDPLSCTLEALRVSGSIVLHHAYAQPWAIRIPSSEALARAVGAERTARVVAFHFAERGEFELRLGKERTTVGPGELAVCFGGRPHTMRRGTATPVVLGDVLAGRSELPAGGDDVPGSTKLLCGVFVMNDPALNPLIASLPSMLRTRILDGHLASTARLLQAELHQPSNGSAFIINRALEVLCAGVLREHMATSGDDAVGIFRALRDSRLSAALEHFHREPARRWSIELLAKRASLSRSRFSSLFTELVGVGPMAYVTSWRMNIAARLLRSSDVSVEQTAEQVGYSNVPAFSRAFKKHLGMPPATYRRSQG